MRAKLRATLFAVVLLIPFGGIGGFMSTGLVKMLAGSWGARDWVLVQASVDKVAVVRSRKTSDVDATYRYTLGGREYVGTRLGFGLDGADNVGDWQESMAELLEEAKASGRTIPVYVNPDDPGDSVVDRDVRWKMVAFMGAFAILFGGVALFALWTLVSVWRGKPSDFLLGGKDAHARDRNRAAVAAARAEKRPVANEDVVPPKAKAHKYGPMIGNVIVAGILVAVLVSIGGCVTALVGTFGGG